MDIRHDRASLECRRLCSRSLSRRPLGRPTGARISLKSPSAVKPLRGGVAGDVGTSAAGKRALEVAAHGQPWNTARRPCITAPVPRLVLSTSGATAPSKFVIRTGVLTATSLPRYSFRSTATDTVVGVTVGVAVSGSGPLPPLVSWLPSGARIFAFDYVEGEPTEIMATDTGKCRRHWSVWWRCVRDDPQVR